MEGIEFLLDTNRVIGLLKESDAAITLDEPGAMEASVAEDVGLRYANPTYAAKFEVGMLGV